MTRRLLERSLRSKENSIRFRNVATIAIFLYFGFVVPLKESIKNILRQPIGAIDDTPTVISKTAETRLSAGSSQQQPTDNASQSTKDYTQKKAWRFDEASPEIQKSQVHFLSSVPDNFRLSLDMKGADGNLTKALDLYASNEENNYPKKHHLGEFNPSIARLPKSYLTDQDWLQAFGDNIPLYVATYRVSITMSCIPETHKLTIQYGGDYHDWRETSPKTEFLGMALLNSDLDIIADVTYDFRKGGLFRTFYQDYRIFNLRGGDGTNEHLYLSSAAGIVPIALTIPRQDAVDNDKPPISGYKKLRPPEMFSPNNDKHPPFQLWHRAKYACVTRKGKNFLFFDQLVTANATDTTHFETRVMIYPQSNPNEVIPIDLSTGTSWCKNREPDMPYMADLKNHTLPFPEPSFSTMEQESFPEVPRDPIFTEDRSSACCFRVREDEIPIAPSMADYVPNVTKHENDGTLMVALVHFKTTQAKVKGLVKNLYLSRFIAFLPKEPYTIVARSGAFCLGSLTAEENTINPPELHDFWTQENTMNFIHDRVDGCTRIHFPMSMIEKATSDNLGHNTSEEEKIIISYGVQDCFSRFVEVKKKDIVAMFGGNNHSKHSISNRIQRKNSTKEFNERIQRKNSAMG